jgi:O-antigen/teichoic acid export membrane protein
MSRALQASQPTKRSRPRASHSAATLLGGRLTRHTAIYALGTLAVGPFSIVSVVFLTRLLAPAQYGELALLLVFAGFLTTLYNIGTLHGTFLFVYGVSEGGEGDDVESDATVTSAPRRALGTGVVLSLIVVTFGTLLCFVLAPTLAHLQLLHYNGAVTSLRWAAISGAAGSLWRLTVNVFRMEGRPISFAALNCLRPLFVVGGSVPFVAIGLGVNGALAGTTFGTIIATLVCVALARRSYAFAFSRSDAREILRRGASVVIPVVCLYILHNGDIYLLGRYASPHELGVYRVASRFAAVPSYFASAFLMAWSPLQRGVLYQAASQQLGAERTRASMLTYYLVVGMTIVLLLDVTGGAMVLLAGPAYRAAAPLIPMLGISFVGYGLFIVIVRTVPIERRILWYTIGALIAAALDVACSTVLIPWLGAYGTPASELVGLGTACLLWVVLATHIERVPVPFEWRRLAGLLAAVLGAAAIQVLGEALLPQQHALVLLMVVLVYTAVMICAGVVPRTHVRPLVLLAKAAVRERISPHDPVQGLASLSPKQRSLLTSLQRDQVSASVLADRLGVGVSEVLAEHVAALRELTHTGPPQAEFDARVGAYLLSKEPEAQRDQTARELVEQGVSPMDLLQMNDAALRLRTMSKIRWASHREQSKPTAWWIGHRQREIERLTEILMGLPTADRRAAIAILRDGQTLREASAGTGLSTELLGARVVRALRGFGNLGPGGPQDAAVGLALLEAQPGDSSAAKAAGERRGAQAVELGTGDAHAIAAVYDEVRKLPRRTWRRTAGPRMRPRWSDLEGVETYRPQTISEGMRPRETRAGSVKIAGSVTRMASEPLTQGIGMS